MLTTCIRNQNIIICFWVININELLSCDAEHVPSDKYLLTAGQRPIGLSLHIKHVICH